MPVLASRFFFMLSPIFIFMKSTSGNKKNKNIERLRTLCNELKPRDDQLKKDLRMFEGFFSNFPVPVTMWSIGKGGTVLSKWGNAFTCKDPRNLEEMFECPVLRDESLKKHTSAFLGNVMTYFVEYNDQLFWCKLVPRENDAGDVMGVLGMAWDVTSNAVMLQCLETILGLLDSDADPRDIRNEAVNGLNASRLKKMLDEENLADA